MDKILHLTLLYDFYVELLTDKQQQMFEMYHLDDLSMQEIGDHFGISRQSVSDLIRRTQKLLDGYEKRLNLVKDYNLNKARINLAASQIDALIDENQNRFDKEKLLEIKETILKINED